MNRPSLVPVIDATEGRPIDAGIRKEVDVLSRNGIETFESCEGGDGHAFFEPTIRFHGDQSEGFKALAGSSWPWM